jgi:hypothetical protein
MNIGQNDANLHEGLAFLEQAEMFDVLDARLFEKGYELGIVEVPLRVEIAVANFDGMMELEVGHVAIIPA